LGAFEIIQRDAEDGTSQVQQYIDQVKMPVPFQISEDFEYVQSYQRRHQGKKRMSLTTSRPLKPPIIISKPYLNAAIFFSFRVSQIRTS
jgi:hypothetical protein